MVNLTEKVRNKSEEIKKSFELGQKNNELIKRLLDKTDEITQKINLLEEQNNRTKNDLDIIRSMLGQRSAIMTSKNKKNKILVMGFFGAFNLGDELMLEALLTNIDKKRYEITIALCGNYRPNINRYGGYQFIYYPNSVLELNDLAFAYDILVFPGGAILDDENYGLDKEHLTLGTILLTLSHRFIVLNKACLIYGISANSNINNQNFINDLSYTINNSKHFSLRDTNSLKTLRNAGIDSDKIEIVNDAVFGHPVWEKIKLKNGANKIGLIYIFNEENLDKLVGFTKKILELTKKEKLEIIPFYDYLNNDIKFANKLVDFVNNNRLSIRTIKLGNMEETLDILNEYSTIISMRYHGTLLSNMLSKNVICINYDKHKHYNNKNYYLFEKYGFEKNVLEFSKLSTYNTSVLKSLLNKKTKNIQLRKQQKKTRDYLSNLINDKI